VREVIGMQFVYSPEHARHNPRYEFLDGRLVPYYESPQRAEIIRAALERAGHAQLAPRSHGLEPIEAVHSAEYMRFFEHAYERWVAAGGAEEGVLPSTFAVRRFGRHSPDPLAEPGYYCFDQSGVIVATTYAAAIAAADVALTAADLLLEGQPCAYALCRPPGHHAGRDLYGGYCFLNNAAIAAQYLLDSAGSGQESVAILDIDFHHGNGTQDIFYERSDVLFVSIHADPARHYPYFMGNADERGAGAGAGYTLNLPLERGVNDARYLQALEQALAVIAGYGPRWLVVSAGFDTFAEDPVARNDFALTQAAYNAIGTRIAALGLPTLHIQEGGYAVAALGENVARYLQGFTA
jgi:acetoin utilization deacetylase AcuC-like enzyme